MPLPAVTTRELQLLQRRRQLDHAAEQEYTRLAQLLTTSPLARVGDVVTGGLPSPTPVTGVVGDVPFTGTIMGPSPLHQMGELYGISRATGDALDRLGEVYGITRTADPTPRVMSYDTMEMTVGGQTFTSKSEVPKVSCWEMVKGKSGRNWFDGE